MDYTIDKVSADGFSMEYLRFGNGKKAFVILPGLSIQSVMFSAPAIVKQYERFTEDFTVYVFDRRQELPPVYKVSDMAEDTVKAINILGLRDISVFGASQGGMIALTIAADNPLLVRRVAVASTVLRIDEKSFSVIDEWIRLAGNGDREELYLSFGQKIYSQETYEKYKDALISIAKTVTEKELERFVILAKGAQGFDLSGKADSIRCPVLIAGDTEDAVFGIEYTDELAKNICPGRDFTMNIYTGYGHAVYDMAPDFMTSLFIFMKG